MLEYEAREAEERINSLIIAAQTHQRRFENRRLDRSVYSESYVQESYEELQKAKDELWMFINNLEG